jgi:hypothetical protein
MNQRLTWEYSRNQKRHTAYDKDGEEVFRIKTDRPDGQIRKKEDIYTLHRFSMTEEWPAVSTSAKPTRLKRLAEALANQESLVGWTCAVPQQSGGGRWFVEIIEENHHIKGVKVKGGVAFGAARWVPIFDCTELRPPSHR